MRRTLLMLTTLLFACCSPDSESQAETLLTTNDMTMNITIGGETHGVTLADNAATQALVEKLQEGPVSINLNTNGDFEIWGALGFSLPTSNEYIDCQPGDVVLYAGSNICIFYGYNSYSYTRLGRIDGLSAEQLKTFLKGGQRNISVTLSLPEATAIGSAPAESDGASSCYALDGRKLAASREKAAETFAQGIYIRNGKKIIGNYIPVDSK